MRLVFFFSLIVITSSSITAQSSTLQQNDLFQDTLNTFLAEIWKTEQVPLRLRDSIGNVHGFESKEFKKQEAICNTNHAINEEKVTNLLDNHGWPSYKYIRDQGNLTICNVLQHSSLEIRLKYLPMMKKAVEDDQLPPRLLARAEDRIATDRNELQIYGGQMKFYPETNSFNLWPVYDPVNIDMRRALIGLGPIAEHLKARFNFSWDLDEQLQRTAEFIKNKKEEKD